MGFTYSSYGLCCDFCDHDHTDRKWVKKLRCPYGYCQSWACCDQCHKLKKHLRSSCAILENNIQVSKLHKEYCKFKINDNTQTEFKFIDSRTGIIKSLSDL